MTQDMLIEEVKRVQDPKAIAALYSYALLWTTSAAKADISKSKSTTHSWGDIVPVKAKSGRSTKEMTDWVRS